MFVHVHCHSHYSFLRGVASPLELVAAAAEQKMPAVTLTDTNGMYAAVPFYLAAHEAGGKPIVGVAGGVAKKKKSERGGESPIWGHQKKPTPPPPPAEKNKQST